MNRLLLTLLSVMLAYPMAMARHYDLTAQRITTADGLPTNVVSRIWQADDGFIWLETRSGLCRWDGYAITRLNTTVPPTADSLSTRDARWQREGRGMLSRRGRDGSVRSWQLIPEDIIAYTRNDHFHVADADECTEVISTYGAGLYLYDKPTGELTNVADGVIDNPYLTGLCVDRSGCIWVVEDYLGVKCLRMSRLSHRWQPLAADAAVMDANYVRCIAPTSGGGLLCSNQMGQVYSYDPETHQMTLVSQHESRVYAALTDGDGALWLGTRGKGLYRNGHGVMGLPSLDVYCIRQSDSGNLLVATLGGGVARLQHDGRILGKVLAGRNCHDIARDGQGRWWVAAEDALYRLTTEKGRMEADAAKPGYFVCLWTSPDGTLWAGTMGQGLLNTATDQWYTRQSGLASDNIYAIAGDGRGRLWIGTEEGLTCLQPQTGHTRNYYFAERGLANVFSERAAVSLADGRMLFGTHDGIIEIDGRDDTLAPDSTVTAITAIRVNGEQVTDASLLKSAQNNVTLQFTNFQFAQLQSVLYQYQLEGFDTAWSAPTKEHAAVYRHLPPGRYVFRVRSSDGTGNWGGDTTLEFTIQRPWWNTWWAWCLYVALATAIGWGVVRLLRLNRQLEVERRVAEFKTSFYTRLERELRNPINVVQGAAENVSLGGTTKTTMQSLRRGSLRLRKLMETMGQFNRGITPGGTAAEAGSMATDAKAEGDGFEQHFRSIVETIHASEEEFRELAPPPINSQTLLIVEPDADNLSHLTDTLNPYFHIVGCQLMDHCEAAADSHQPALTLIDISTDQRAAQQLTRRLLAAHPRMVVVHLSDSADESLHLRSLRSGAADFIVKPVGSRILLERITRQLRAVANTLAATSAPAAAATPAPSIPSSAIPSPAVSDAQLPVPTAMPAPTPTDRPAPVSADRPAPVSADRPVPVPGTIIEDAAPPLLTDVKDSKFLDRLEIVLQQHVADPDFSVEQWASLMNLGRTHFYKRVKGLTGQTPVQHLHRARLDHAARLVCDTTMTVEEVMVRAGFHSPTHFYNAFKRQFGLSPNEMRRTKYPK